MSTAFPIPRSDRRVDLTATASQTVFTFPYPTLANQDVGVAVQAPAATGFVALTYGVDYTVSGAPSISSVTVTLTSPATAGAVYRLTGARIPSRTTSLAPYGTSYRAALEAELDNLTLVLQELRRDFQRLEDYANAGVPNTATQAEAQAGTVNSTIMTPLRTRQALEQAKWPGPAWASYSTIYGGLEANINAFPITSRFGSNIVGCAEALAGLVDVPSPSAAGNHSAGVAGYARTASTSQGGVGTFGAGMCAADGVSAWAFNSIITNAAVPNPGNGAGYDTCTLYAFELDFNIVKKGGATPTGPLRGLYFIGASEVQPNSPTVNTIEIDGLNFTGTKIPWKQAFVVCDGAAQTFANIGAINVNTGSTTSDGQPIKASAYSSGALKAGQIYLNSLGNWWIEPTAGSGIDTPSGTIYQVAGAAVADNLAWTAWAPTVASGSGSITTLGTVVARFKRQGKRLYFTVKIPITTNGTGAGNLTFTLPGGFAPFADFAPVGFESTAYGGILQCRGSAGSNNVTLRKYDNTYPGADGATLVVSGTYEIT